LRFVLLELSFDVGKRVSLFVEVKCFRRLCADEAGIEARRKVKKPSNLGGRIELTIPGRSAFWG
jgi:hypothetical protein